MKKRAIYFDHFWKINLLTIFILISSISIGQTFPTSCTSGDLTLIGASLPPPSNDVCNCTGDRVLVLGIHNGTGSFRTSFALWGTLIRKDASGTVIETSSIFACASGIEAKKDNFLNASTIKINGVDAPNSTALGLPTIHIDCGQSLDITDMHLAWTSANANETCTALYNSPSTINPKCGTQALVHVGIGVDATFTAFTDPTCQNGGANGSITVAPSGGKAPYKVKLGIDERTAIATGGTTTFTGLSASTYNFLITDANGCTTTKMKTLTPPATVTADAGANFTITCSSNPNGKVIGEATSTDYTYSWSPSAGLSSTTASQVTANPGSNTTYVVTKTSIATGCSNTDDVVVTVDKTTPTADAGANKTVTCTTSSASLTATGGVSYLWSTGQTINPISVSPTSTTVYNVTVTGSNGCTAVDNVTVVADKAAPSADAGANKTVTCSTTSATLTATGGVSYLWSTGQTINPISVSPTSTTVYNVTVTGSNGCTGVDNVTVVANNANPSFTVCFTQPNLCTLYGSVTINATGGSGFEYKLNSGAFAPNNTIGNLTSGSVSTITVKNSDGCTSTQSCSNFVENCSGGSQINRQTPTYIGEETSSTTVKAYPNPFSDRIKFLVNSSVGGNGSLEIYNMMGQKVKTVYTGVINAGPQTFELSLPLQQVSNLVYVLRVGDKRVTGKILQINQ